MKMSNFQNVRDSIITVGDVNAPINNKSKIYSSPNIGTIDWNRLTNEVATLNSQQLPPSARQFGAEMKEACAKKDESKVKRICCKMGSFVLAFAESLGLELIASLITACIMG